jgi:hypothetical protein
MGRVKKPCYTVANHGSNDLLEEKMNMQDHILAALREQLEGWEALLASLDDEQRTTPLSPSPWSVKDELAHLRAWQQRSIARLEAAHQGGEPEFPHWLEGKDPESENVDEINTWIYESNRSLPWTEVYTKWREGYRHLIELGGGISERDLLDSSMFPWMKGYSLADVLLATYDHHQEHLEVLVEWLRAQGD